MRSSVQKNFLRSLLVLPITINCAFAQSPNTLPETVSVSAVAKKAMSAQMNDLFISQWVRTDSTGSVNGSVATMLGQNNVSLSRIRVALSQNGKIVRSADTMEDGEFLIEKVVPGVYTLTAEGNGSVAMFSLVVMDSAAGNHLANNVEVRVMGKSNRVAEILRGQSSPKMARTMAPTAVALESDPLGAGRRFASSDQVLLDAQGVLNGRLGKAMASVDMSNMTVFVMKDGQEVQRARVGADGSFAVSGLAPACYGLVAAGDQGSAVVGFCAVGRSVVSSSKDGKVFVASAMQAAQGMYVEIGDNVTTESSEIQEEVIIADSAPMSEMGPGFGGGSGGGGSGGGAGGGGGLGLGGLAAIGGLTALGIIAGTNNDAPVASSIVPMP